LGKTKKKSSKYFKKNFGEIQKALTFATPIKNGEAEMPKDL
jgi:hypothetical protein